MKDEVSEYCTLTKLARTSSFRLPPSSFPSVPLAVPYWNGETYRAISRSLLRGAVIHGTALESLRAQICKTLNAKTVVLCGSGSLALELALRACRVGPGDEVVIPTFCCSAVVPPILAVGATPVLADVGIELNLSADTVVPVLTQKTRAIVVPHLFGNPAEIAAIVELASKRNIRVIDDAAQALGATIDERPVGSFGDLGILSFGREKICFGLGGGALVFPGEPLAGTHLPQLLRPSLGPAMTKLLSTVFWNRWRRWTAGLGKIAARRLDPDSAPERYRHELMANMNAAVALSLIATLDENIAARRQRVSAYQTLLGGDARLQLVAHRPGSACLSQVVRVLPGKHEADPASRIISAFGNAGYEIQGSYVPIHLIENLRGCVWERLPNAERVWADLIELPCEPSVGLDRIEQIAGIIKRTLGS